MLINELQNYIQFRPAEQAAEKRFPAVILSEAKNLALRIFMNIRDSSFATLRTACGSSE